MSNSGWRRLVAFQIYALITSILMVHSAVNSWRINTREDPDHLQGRIRMLLFSRVSMDLSMDLLLGEAREKRKWQLSSGKALTHLSRLFEYRPKFDTFISNLWPYTSGNPIWVKQKEVFFSISKTLGKKIKHLASILLAKVTTTYALVGNYKIWNIWSGNQCP